MSDAECDDTRLAYAFGLLDREQPAKPEILVRGHSPDLLVHFGDLHCGHQHAACPPQGFTTDAGHVIPPNQVQAAINRPLDRCLDRVEEIAGGRSYGLLCTGDVVEGEHHRAKDLLTNNLKAQVDNCIVTYRRLIDGGAWLKMARGTPAHTGQESETEEHVAQAWGADQNALGQYSSQVWLFRWHDQIVHLAHHIPTTGTASRRSAGPWGELAELMYSAGEVGSTAPDIICRGHRHVEHAAGEGSPQGMRWTLVNPPWVAPNAFGYKVRGGRTGNPRMGVVIVERMKDGRVVAWCETFFLDPTLPSMGGTHD